MQGTTLQKLQVIIEAYTKPFRDEIEKAQNKTKKANEAINKNTNAINKALNNVSSKKAVNEIEALTNRLNRQKEAINKQTAVVDNLKNKLDSLASQEMTGLESKYDKQTEQVEKQQAAVDQLKGKLDALTNGDVRNKTIDNLSKDLAKSEKEFTSVEAEMQKLLDKLDQAEDFESQGLSFPGIEDIKKQIDELNPKYEEVEARVDKLKNKLEEAKLNPESTTDFQKLQSDIDLATSKLERLKEEAGSTKSRMNDISMNPASASGADKVSQDIELAKNKLSRLKGEAEQTENKIKNVGDEFTKVGAKAGKASNKATSGLDKIGKKIDHIRKRITSLVGAALVFNVISSGLRKFQQYLSGCLSTNDQFTRSVAQIKTNLQVAFMPIYQAIMPALNALMRGIATATAYIAVFMNKIFGSTYNQSLNAVKNMNKLKKSADGTAKSVKKAQGTIASFDEVHSLNKDESEDDSGLVSPDIDTSAAESKLDAFLNKIGSKLKELKDIFMLGFWEGLGDTSVFDSIQKHIKGIGDSLYGIVTDAGVVSAANSFVDKFVYSIGQRAGALVSIGATIVDNIVGGIDKFLKQDSERIKSFIISMFDIWGSIEEIKGNFSVALADIFSVFRGDNAKQITADILSIFSSAAMGAIEIASKLNRDLLNLITKPFIDNKDKIKEALEGTLEVISSVFGTIKEVVQNTMDKANAVYDAHIKPMIDAITNGISELAGSFLDFYNESVQPVLEKLAEKFKTVVENHVQPAIDKFLELFGKVADMITVLWQNVIQPFIQWIISNILPKLLPVFETIGNTVLDVMANISDAIGGVIDVIGGIVDFVTGVFSGDWQLAWDGIKSIFSGFGTAISNLASAIWSAIKLPFSVAVTFFGGLFDLAWTAIKKAWSAVGAWFKSIWDNITNTFSNAHTWFKEKFSAAWELIKGIFSISNISAWFTARWSDIKNVFSTVDTWFKGKFNSAWEFIKGIFSLSNVSNWFKERYANVTTAFDNTDTWFNGKFGDAWGKIKGVFNEIDVKKWFGDRWSNIQSKFTNGNDSVDTWFGGKFGDAWEKIKGVFSKSKLTSFFGDSADGVWGIIKGLFTNIGKGAGEAISGAFRSVINDCLKKVEDTINKAIGFINTAIGVMNKVPGVNISTVSPVELPRMAKGGVVNSATIAMIGEAGKEAVVPLENNTGWMEKVGSVIGRIVSTNLSMQLATAGESPSNTPINNVIQVDGRTILTIVTEASKRNGVNFRE
jgi:phage-related protein